MVILSRRPLVGAADESRQQDYGRQQDSKTADDSKTAEASKSRDELVEVATFGGILKGRSRRDDAPR